MAVLSNTKFLVNVTRPESFDAVYKVLAVGIKLDSEVDEKSLNKLAKIITKVYS